MPSKEEIENMKEDLKNLSKMLGKKPSISTNAIKNALDYIEQLETKEQKLIEKLEKRIILIADSLPSGIIEKYKNFEITDIDDNTYELLALNDLNTVNEILKILKRENDE